MGKMKEKFMDDREKQSLEDDRYYDDEYQFEQWQKEQALLQAEKNIIENEKSDDIRSDRELQADDNP